MCKSVRQTAHARTLTSNWPGPGCGSGSSASRSGCPGRSSSIARIPLLCREMRALAFTAAIATALIAAPAAAADILGTAQVRTSAGALLAAARDGSFTYPTDGSVLSIGRVAATKTPAALEDPSMLVGRVPAHRGSLPPGPPAQ